MPDLVLPPPWPRFLTEVDHSLSGSGGTPLRGRFCSHRCAWHTEDYADLDYISAIPHQATEELERIAGRGSDLAKRHKVFLQAVGGVGDYPENYESRLTSLPLGLKKLTLRILEPYDLLLSKLTRNSPKDMEDVQALVQKLKLEFDVFLERFRNEMSWVPRRDWHEQTLNVAWKDYFDLPRF